MDPNNIQISGKYRGTPARFYVNLQTGQQAAVDLRSGKFLAGYRTDDKQLWELTMFGTLW